MDQIIKHPLRVLLIFFIIASVSCNFCGSLDCGVGDLYVQFRVLNKQTGNDLLIGPNRVYNPDSVIFFYVKDADTTFYAPEKREKIGVQGYDSLLRVPLFPPAPIVYMRLNSGDVDTLKLGLNSYNTNCCGRLTDITSLRLNDSLITRNLDRVYTFLK